MGNNKSMMIIIIAILVIMLGGVGAGFFFIAGMINKNMEATTGDKPVQTEEKAYTPADLINVPLSDSIKSNLLVSNDGQEHLILITAEIAVNGAGKNAKAATEMETLLKQKEAVVTDSILKILRQKTFQDVKRPDAQQLLSDEIVSALQGEFNSNLIVEVYFKTFFVQ